MKFFNRLSALNIIYIILFISLIINLNSYSQISAAANYSLYYDDNPFRQNEPIEEMINMFNLKLEYQALKSEPLILSYSGGLNSYNKNSDYSYQYHSLGGDYTFLLDKENENYKTNFGVNYTIKSSFSDENYFDFDNIAAYLNTKIYLNETFIITPAYYFVEKKYPNLDELNFSEHILYLKFSKFFKTKTGLILQPSIGFKDYSILKIEENNYSYYGKGKMNRQQTDNYLTSSASQFRLFLNASQNIFEKTGVSLQYMFKKHLKENSDLIIHEYFGSDDQDLWNDPYNYEGNQFGFTLTQKLPLQFSFKVNGSYYIKNYQKQTFDSIVINRKDNRSEFWIGILKSIDLPFINSLDINLEYMFINNNSTETLYNYKNNLFMLTTQLYF